MYMNVSDAGTNGRLGKPVSRGYALSANRLTGMCLAKNKKPVRCNTTGLTEGVAMSTPSQSPTAIIPRQQNKILLAFTNYFASTINLGMRQNRGRSND